MQVEEFLERSAESSPSKTALIFRDRRLTYEEVESAANRLAHAMQDRGLSRWDRVAIFAPNSVEAAISIFAVLKAGGVFVLINPTTKRDRLTFILNDSGATTLITTKALLATALPAADQSPKLAVAFVVGGSPPASTDSRVRWLAFEEALRSQSPGPCERRNIDIDLATLIYTSGSTGRPKGVMMTHANIVAAASSITTYLKNVPDDIILNVLPLSFDYGLYQLLMAWKFGGTLVLEPSFLYPRATLELLDRENVTGFPIVPTMAAILLQMDLSQYAFHHLRYITNTAAALPVQHIQKLRLAMPNVQIYSMYGLTECKRVSYLPPEQLDYRPGSVGRGMPNEEIYLVDGNGQPVPHGQVGELVVRGANVMMGYWNSPTATDEVLKPGPFPGQKILYSGDLFRSDEEGYLYFVGRKDDIIKTRGEKVSPREVEDVLYSHPDVAEAAVIGVPDDILGSAICAFVSPKVGRSLDERAMLAFCAERLENFMIPTLLEIRAHLPKSSNGKIAKRELIPATPVLTERQP